MCDVTFIFHVYEPTITLPEEGEERVEEAARTETTSGHFVAMFVETEPGFSNQNVFPHLNQTEPARPEGKHSTVTSLKQSFDIIRGLL